MAKGKTSKGETFETTENMPRCGALTKKGTKCKNRVRTKGQCCRWHRCAEETATCSICLDSIDGDARRLACQHIYHEQCVGKWFVQCAHQGDGSPTCPLCRDVVTDSPTLAWIEQLTADDSASDDDWEPSSFWQRIAARALEGRRRIQSRRGLLRHIRGLYARVAEDVE